MAFVSMFIVFIVIAAVIFGLMLITGLILLIVGIVNKSRPKHSGKKFPMVCIVSGSVLLALPLMAAAVVMFWGIAGVVKEAFQSREYDSLSERWSSQLLLTDSDAAEQAIEGLLSSADTGDREAFAKHFTPELQASEGFDEALDSFFAAYPTGLSQCDLDGGRGSGSDSYDAGHTVKTAHADYKCMQDGNWYSIMMVFCYKDTDDPDKVGVTKFTIMNLEAAAVFEDEFSRNPDYLDDVYLLCDIKSSDEVSARLIGGWPLLWTPTDTPKLTAEQMRELIAGHDRLDDKDLRNTIGTANAAIKYSNCSWVEYYYEIKDENGEPRYVCIHTNSPFDEPDIPYGEILSAYKCTPYEIDFHDPLFEYEGSE